MPVPVATFAPDANVTLPAVELTTTCEEGALTAPPREMEAPPELVACKVRLPLAVMVELNPSVPVPVWVNVVAPVAVTGAASVRPGPCVVLLPLSEMVEALTVKDPVEVGPIVAPAMEKLEVAWKLWLLVAVSTSVPELRTIFEPLTDTAFDVDVPAPTVVINPERVAVVAALIEIVPPAPPFVPPAVETPWTATLLPVEVIETFPPEPLLVTAAVLNAPPTEIEAPEPLLEARRVKEAASLVPVNVELKERAPVPV